MKFLLDLKILMKFWSNIAYQLQKTYNNLKERTANQDNLTIYRFSKKDFFKKLRKLKSSTQTGVEVWGWSVPRHSNWDCNVAWNQDRGGQNHVVVTTEMNDNNKRSRSQDKLHFHKNIMNPKINKPVACSSQQFLAFALWYSQYPA